MKKVALLSVTLLGQGLNNRRTEGATEKIQTDNEKGNSFVIKTKTIMKKIKLFLCVALFGAMSFGAFSAYDHLTMNADEMALLANIEALTNGEETGASTPCFGSVEDTNVYEDEVFIKIYCGTCRGMLGVLFKNPSKCKSNN